MNYTLGRADASVSATNFLHASDNADAVKENKMITPADIAKMPKSDIYTVEQKRMREAEQAIAIKQACDTAKKPAVDAFKKRMAKRKFEYNWLFDKVVKPVWAQLYEKVLEREDAKRAKALGLTLEEAYALYLPHKLEKKNKKFFGQK